MSNFSIVVPVYYGEKHIPNIIHQMEACKKRMRDEDNIEILFVNDAPNAPLNPGWYSEVIDITVINTDKNIGIHGTRLKGLAQCRGEYILFLDQDDKIEPDYFESQKRCLGDGDAVVCKAIHDKKERYDEYLPFEQAVTKEYMISSGNGIVSPGQVMLRRKAISSVWIMNTMIYNGADDWLLWICMMSEEKKFVLNYDVLYEHVVDGKNTSDNLLEMTYSEHEIISILERENILGRDDYNTLKMTVDRLCQERIRRMDRFWRRYYLNASWLQLCYDHFSIAMYLRKQGYQTVAIYGCGYYGKQLYRELKNSCVEVVYFIDRNAAHLNEEIPIYKIEEDLPETDMIIITFVQDVDSVIKLLEEKIATRIVCLQDLLEDVKGQEYR